MASNIEPRARAFCEQGLRCAGMAEAEIASAVERYWHCVAAEIEAGLIDDDGRQVPHSFDDGLAAYRDWRVRHP